MLLFLQPAGGTGQAVDSCDGHVSTSRRVSEGDISMDSQRLGLHTCCAAVSAALAAMSSGFLAQL